MVRGSFDRRYSSWSSGLILHLLRSVIVVPVGLIMSGAVMSKPPFSAFKAKARGSSPSIFFHGESVKFHGIRVVPCIAGILRNLCILLIFSLSWSEFRLLGSC